MKIARATNLDRKSGVAEGRDLQFLLVEKRKLEVVPPLAHPLCPKVKLQVPPLRYPGFPVEIGGVGELHADFLTESRTRGRC